MKHIAVRFAVMLAAAAVVPLLAYGAWSMVSLRAGATATVIEGNTNAAARVAEQIALYVTSSVRILNALAGDLQQTGLQRWQQDRIVKNYVLEFPEFRELTLLDANAQPIVSSRLGAVAATLPGSDSFTVRGALVSRFGVDDDLLPSAVVAVRMRGTSQENGWLVGRLSLEELWRMVDRIRVDVEGRALVIAGDGRLVAHGNPNAKSMVARGDNMSSHPLFVRVHDSAVAPEGVASAEYPGVDGRDMLGVAALVPELAWTVIVEQPRAEAFAIPIALQNQLGAAITVALLAMLGVGYFWGRSFITPILSLTRGTAALAEGHLDERVAVHSKDELGQLGHAFNNMADRLVALQEDVRRTERQAMFGRVAIGLVHDLSHPIMNIGNSCKLITRMWDDDEYRDSFTRTVEHELSQVKRVLDDLRNVARPVPLDRFPIDVNRTLPELIASMQPTAASAGVTLESRLSSEPLVIDADLFALNRVYHNLITNALQATPSGGRVAMHTERRRNTAVIEVSDTGAGIPAERLDSIFDDFMTTKKRGLGLGLAISKKVVEQLGGTITVRSEVGVGSTFTLTFPVSRTPPPSSGGAG